MDLQERCTSARGKERLEHRSALTDKLAEICVPNKIDIRAPKREEGFLDGVVEVYNQRTASLSQQGAQAYQGDHDERLAEISARAESLSRRSRKADKGQAKELEAKTAPLQEDQAPTASHSEQAVFLEGVRWAVHADLRAVQYVGVRAEEAGTINDHSSPALLELREALATTLPDDSEYFQHLPDSKEAFAFRRGVLDGWLKRKAEVIEACLPPVWIPRNRDTRDAHENAGRAVGKRWAEQATYDQLRELMSIRSPKERNRGFTGITPPDYQHSYTFQSGLLEGLEEVWLRRRKEDKGFVEVDV